MRSGGLHYEGDVGLMGDGGSQDSIEDYHLIKEEEYTLLNTVSPPGYARFRPVTLVLNRDGELEVPDGDGVVSTDGHTLTVGERPTTLAVGKTDLASEPIASSEAQFSVEPVEPAEFANVEEPGDPKARSTW